MLQYRAVYPPTLELLKALMGLPELEAFFLVGGTALALQIGHRISVDIDLFTQEDFDPHKLTAELNQQFIITDLSVEKNTLQANLTRNSPAPVKVDFIKYPYPLLNPIINIDGIRFLSLEDIIPMKLSAVAGRGSKKDFYDLFYLLKSYSLEQMFELFQKKFPNANKFHVLRSLIYFRDSEQEPNPKTIQKTAWEEVKATISKVVSNYSH